MELLNYVTPKSVDKFVGNKMQTKSFSEFMNSIGKKNIICVIGPDGCGKTTLCNLMFKKHNKQVLEIGKDNLVGSDIKVVLQNFANNMTIDELLLKKEKVVFVDDVDILMNIDKLVLSKLFGVDKVLRQKKIRVVITCNLSEEKKMNEHIKDMDIIKLAHPFYKDSYAYIMNCFNAHDVDHDAQLLLSVTQKCRGNIRETMLNLESSLESLQEKMSEDSFKDLNNFEITRKILSMNYTLPELMLYQSGDVGIIPYMLYENIPDEMDINYKFKKGKNVPSLIDHYIKVNDAFIVSSQFEDKAYSSMDWQYFDYGNMIKMYTIHSVLNELEKKATVKDVKYRFSQMLSKTSHKNIMAKKVKGLSNNMNVSKMMIVNAVDVQTQNKEVQDGDDGNKEKTNNKEQDDKEKRSKTTKTSKTSKTPKTIKETNTANPTKPTRKKALPKEETRKVVDVPLVVVDDKSLVVSNNNGNATSLANTYEKYFA